MTGLAQIGGFLAIMRVGLFLSFLHQKGFEKKLVAKLEQQNIGEKVDIEEAKKVISVESFF